jgi:long-chain acyl-CoA synthetase
MKIADDLKEIKPTIFCSVPRLFTRFYTKMKEGLDAKGGIAKFLINKAFASKLQYLHNGPYYTHGIWDK